MKIYVDYPLNAACRRRLDQVTEGHEVWIARRQAGNTADREAREGGCSHPLSRGSESV